ncbi:MAG: DUF429 domain-containing protein [Desulfobacteraceae bacterium]|uniref:DUF429 domain-containing protein n=1 Tax=Candidatus Desulfacyla euxinica TaxID=2841693 RepID=A0A8J6MYB7_9DELT|nr:DUF429 domain-containing protein [Candidatus Desulfacyla euxinica]MBL6979119.1 DUF429 domain-containing protein [Desulfobacteraceae bacterium]MBL7216818.1 DUF429 domain-containing protein [Desulfobacteraceae bacterium]
MPELWQATKKEALILIDIPIGLSSREKLTRQCGRMASYCGQAAGRG